MFSHRELVVAGARLTWWSILAAGLWIAAPERHLLRSVLHHLQKPKTRS